MSSVPCHNKVEHHISKGARYNQYDNLELMSSSTISQDRSEHSVNTGVAFNQYDNLELVLFFLIE